MIPTTTSGSQITKVDTLVQYLVDEKRISPQEAWGHPRRSLVSKVLTGQAIDPFLEARQVKTRDRYLICSDGLSDHVPVETIREALRLRDPHLGTQHLIRLALQHGSHDNITCIVADVVEGASGYNLALLTGAAGRKAMLVG